MHWERLQALLPADSEAARQIQSNIAQARAMSAGAPTARSGSGTGASIRNTDDAATDATATTASPAADPSPARISGTARIADALRDQVQPGDTVFILARPIAGSRMPLAIAQWRVSDLPRAFVLDDSSAMSPQAKLSGASRVQVEIRISRAGKAAAQPGDLSGVLPDVDIRARDLELVADTVVR
ncbi:hypothetical protein D3C85_321870 [compost metagenome]